MTKEQEAQQAKNIEQITKRLENDEAWMSQSAQSGRDYTIEDRQALLRIVDSQAQKIEQQDADIANLLNKLANWQATYERQELKIAEQAAELNVTKTMLNDMNEICSDQAKELKLLRYVLESEKTARIYEDGTGAAGEALFHARKELEDYDAKMIPEQTTDSKEVAR